MRNKIYELGIDTYKYIDYILYNIVYTYIILIYGQYMLEIKQYIIMFL